MPPRRKARSATNGKPRPVAVPEPGGAERRKGIDPCTSEPSYSDAERDFLVAMERYKRLNRRPFPTLREVLQVLVALGYRHVAAPQPLPGYDAAQARRAAEK